MLANWCIQNLRKIAPDSVFATKRALVITIQTFRFFANLLRTKDKKNDEGKTEIKGGIGGYSRNQAAWPVKGLS